MSSPVNVSDAGQKQNGWNQRDVPKSVARIKENGLLKIIDLEMFLGRNVSAPHLLNCWP